MGTSRYNRWQGLAISQFSVAIALISGWSLSGLGVCFALVQSDKLIITEMVKPFLLAAFICFFVAAIFCCIAVLTRTIDFRLTARKIRLKEYPEYKNKLTIFLIDSNQYGKLSWASFWLSFVSFLTGGAAIAVSVFHLFSGKLT
ncbi:hypothetical protein AB6Q56_06755 [Dechloromonas sp. ARDL1]|uniref:hypothetical protein n=1 Tax=Dechloromonas sp. ARDL1 TaxID=3322121 RepID=UPI003DA6D8EB